jgi:hypothetical protein
MKLIIFQFDKNSNESLSSSFFFKERADRIRHRAVAGSLWFKIFRK